MQGAQERERTVPAALGNPPLDRTAKEEVERGYADAEDDPRDAVRDTVHAHVQPAEDDAEGVPCQDGDGDVVGRWGYRLGGIESVHQGVEVQRYRYTVCRMGRREAILQMMRANR